MTRQVSRQTGVYTQIQKSANLPSLAEVLLQVLDTCNDDAVTPEELATAVSVDPGLSYKVMQLANSAYYAGASKISNLAQAVTCLGNKVIFDITQTSSVHQIFERKRLKKAGHFNHCTFWFHSLLCAVIARELAKKTGYRQPAEAYLAGLIHDIGRLALVTAFPKEHEAILLETESKQNVLWAEEQLLGITHCQAGSWLIKKWHGDSLLADAVKYHHESEVHVAQAFPLVKLVYLANLLSDAMENNEQTTDIARQLFKLPAADLETILTGAIADVCTIAKNLGFSVDLPDFPECLKTDKTTTVEMAADNGKTSSSSAKQYPVNGNIRNQVTLINRIKHTSLLSGFMEKCIQAGGIEEIVASYEQAVNILFQLEKVMLFLPDKSGFLLEGYTSPHNGLHHMVHGFSLSVRQSISAIAQTYDTGRHEYLRVDEGADNMADSQILEILGCQTILLLPLRADKSAVGVALLGLPEAMAELPASELQMLNVLTQQMSLNIHLEQSKLSKSKEIEAERLAVVSMTAKKVAHEINNPLGIINNYLKTMSIRFADNTELQGELGIIGEEIERISRMVNQLGLLSPAENLEMEMVNVNSIIADIIQLSQAALFGGSDTTLVFQPGDDIPTIRCSKNGLKQIMMNLLKNAAEAMTAGGKVEVITEALGKTDDSGGSFPGSGLRITVADNGPGLPEMVVANLFKPFVTTKKSGHSGLGLSIVQKLVSEMKGEITCDSTSAGTRFIMVFPAA